MRAGAAGRIGPSIIAVLAAFCAATQSPKGSIT